MALEFIEEGHQYLVDGQPVPHVTGLLQGMHSFAGVPLDVLEFARNRGSRAHRVCHYYDEGDFGADQEEQLRQNWPDEWGYLQGWKRFTADTKPKWLAIEKPVYHHLLRYAGMLDRQGSLTVGKRHIPESILDIKTAEASHPVWGVQTMAYAHAAGCPKAPRFTVQLKKNGTYRLLEWKDAQDWPVFVSLTTLHTWRSRNGI